MGRSAVLTEAVHTEISRIQAFLNFSSKETPFSSLLISLSQTYAIPLEKQSA